MVIPLSNLCGGNLETPIKIDIYNRKSKTQEKLKGETITTAQKLLTKGSHFSVINSKRKKPAATWDNQVEDDVKQDRLQRINELNKQHAAQRRARMLGRTEQVLVEERNVKVPTQVMGRTRHGYIVYCDGDIDELRGKVIDVEIDTCQTYYLAGKRV